jgi:hypothetical protein
MHSHQHHRYDTVLLSGWLFADLLLGLMMIFLMAVPGISPTSTAEPVLVVSPTSLDPKSDQCTGEMSNLKCTVTLGETATSQGDMIWTANSDMSDSVAFSPTNGMLSPGKSVTVDIAAIPCQHGSFTFAGSRGARPVIIAWRCTPPPASLDFNPQTFTLTIHDIPGLLNNPSTQSSIDDIKGQVKSQPFLNGRRVGLAVVRGGTLNDDGINQAKQVAGRIYLILQKLGQDNFAFQNSAYYSQGDPLYDLGTDSSSAHVDIYLFKQ